MMAAVLRIVGASQYSQSKPIFGEPSQNESFEAYERRVWRQHIHQNANGEVYLPAAAFKKALDGAASLTKRKVTGNQTYADQFLTGIIIADDIPLTLPRKGTNGYRFDPEGAPVLAKDLQPIELFCSAKGDRRGLGSRVIRLFPVIPLWAAEFQLVIVNDTITREIFETYVKEAGLLTGVGRWRPAMGGQNGRFRIESIAWKEGYEF